MNLGRTILESATRVLVAHAIRSGLKFTKQIIHGIQAQQECHQEGLKLLEGWLKWARVRGTDQNEDVPLLLMLATLKIVKDHSNDEPDVAFVTATMHKMSEKQPAGEAPVAEESNKDGG